MAATRSFTKGDRGRQWSEITGFVNVAIKDDREASIRKGHFGDVRICQLSSGATEVTQATPAEDSLKGPTLRVIFLEEGKLVLHQAGRSAQLVTGQWCALRNDIAYQATSGSGCRQLAVELPCSTVPDLMRGIAWWHTARSYLTGSSSILYATASASVQSAAQLSHDQGCKIGDYLVDLLRMAVRDVQQPLSIRETRRRAALDYIERHLADAQLNVAAIARALHCTERTLHKVFEGQNRTVTRVIWEKRLERCRAELLDPALLGQSITEIALFWGFCDSQHFSRAFKNRFGMTPRECRGFALSS